MDLDRQLGLDTQRKKQVASKELPGMGVAWERRWCNIEGVLD
jgi:hypothetical protein